MFFIFVFEGLLFTTICCNFLWLFFRETNYWEKKNVSPQKGTYHFFFFFSEIVHIDCACNDNEVIDYYMLIDILHILQKK